MRVVNLEQHERIKEELHKRGLSLAQVARDMGVSISTVSIVFQGFQRSKRVEAQIALALEATPQGGNPPFFKLGISRI